MVTDFQRTSNHRRQTVHSVVETLLVVALLVADSICEDISTLQSVLAHSKRLLSSGTVTPVEIACCLVTLLVANAISSECCTLSIFANLTDQSGNMCSYSQSEAHMTYDSLGSVKCILFSQSGPVKPYGQVQIVVLPFLLQVPSFWHGSVKQLNCVFCSHILPWNPTGHSQENERPLLEHFPPFAHGLSLQTSENY